MESGRVLRGAAMAFAAADAFGSTDAVGSTVALRHDVAGEPFGPSIPCTVRSGHVRGQPGRTRTASASDPGTAGRHERG
jgi:hypothetical protein